MSGRMGCRWTLRGGEGEKDSWADLLLPSHSPCCYVWPWRPQTCLGLLINTGFGERHTGARCFNLTEEKNWTEYILKGLNLYFCKLFSGCVNVYMWAMEARFQRKSVGPGFQPCLVIIEEFLNSCLYFCDYSTSWGRIGFHLNFWPHKFARQDRKYKEVRSRDGEKWSLEMMQRVISSATLRQGRSTDASKIFGISKEIWINFGLSYFTEFLYLIAIGIYCI